MIRKHLLIILMIFCPAYSHASDMSGLIYIMGIQAIFTFLPLVLPLYFLKNLSQKIKMYFIFLVLVYGINGLIGLPVLIYSQVSIWLGAAGHLWSPLVIQQLIGIGLSLFAMDKYGSRLASCFTNADEQ